MKGVPNEREFTSEITASLRAQLDAAQCLYHAKIEVPAHYTKKNDWGIRYNRASGRRFIGASRKGHFLDAHLVSELRRRAVDFGIDKPLTCRLWAMFVFHIERTTYFTVKKKINRRLPDQSNLYQGPEDALIKAGIIKDDTQIDSHDLSRRLPGDKNEVEVFLFKFQGYL